MKACFMKQAATGTPAPTVCGMSLPALTIRRPSLLLPAYPLNSPSLLRILSTTGRDRMRNARTHCVRRVGQGSWTVRTYVQPYEARQLPIFLSSLLALFLLVFLSFHLPFNTQCNTAYLTHTLVRHYHFI